MKNHINKCNKHITLQTRLMSLTYGIETWGIGVNIHTETNGLEENPYHNGSPRQRAGNLSITELMSTAFKTVSSAGRKTKSFSLSEVMLERTAVLSNSTLL